MTTTTRQPLLLKSVLFSFTFLLVSLFCINATAATRTWTGSTSTSWSTASNWSTSVVPASGDIVNIPGGLSRYPNINTTITVGAVTISSTGSGASLTVSSGGSFTAGAVTINNNGTYTQTGGTSKVTGITIAGSLNISGGTLLSTVNIVVNSTGTLTQTGGLIHLALNTATDPSDDMIINPGGDVIQTGGTIATHDLQILSNSTATFTQNENTSASLLTIGHDYINTGGNFTSTAGTINWTGVANASASAEYNLGTNQFFNVKLDGSHYPGFANDANGAISVRGNWTNNNTTTDLITLATTVTFNGTATQSIGGSQVTTFYNMTVNKATDTITLAKSITVNNVLTLTKGIVKSTSANLLSLPSTASTTGSSNSSYIQGPIKKTNLVSGFIFSVGYNGMLKTATILSASLSTDAYTVEYVWGMPNDTSKKPSGVNVISSREYWVITHTGTGTATLVLAWDDSSKVTSPSNLRMMHWNGTSWDNLSGFAFGSSSFGILSVAGVNPTGVFTFGSSTTTNPLPVKLMSFTAKASDNTSVLNWSTATEKDNDHFNIERSLDGVNFTTVGEVAGNGTTNNISNYSSTDFTVAEMAASTVYYRLKQVDYSGAFEYSNIVTVSFAKQTATTISNVYPNPFQNELSVNYTLPVSGNVTISLIDAQGRVVATNETEGRKGANTFEFNTADYAKGIYFVNVNFNSTSTTYKMIVKQ